MKLISGKSIQLSAPLAACWILVVVVTCSVSTAQVTYVGRDTPAGQGWRATADAMIDQHRKGDLIVRVQNFDGSPVSNAAVQVDLQRHAFLFGSAVDARLLDPSQPEYNPTFGAKFQQNFNSGGFFNNLKWRAWVGDFSTGLEPPVTQAGIDWFQSRNIAVRGHTMMWPRYQSVPNSVRALLDIPNPTQQDLQALYDSTFSHIASIGSATNGDIFAWDMLNEPRTSNDIEDKLVGFTPQNAPTITSQADLRARWFQAAKLASPGATMMINDFQIVPGAGLADPEPAAYQAQIDAILTAGGPVEGIGFQSHFSDLAEFNGRKNPVGPVDVWALFDNFDAKYNVPLHVTEFDFESTDLQLQADYTRDYLTAVFAHPAMDAFMMWGFWEGDIEKTSAALYNANWTPKANGLAYQDLVLNQWWTTESGTSNATGDYSVRGFRGDYQVSVTHNGATVLADAVVGAGSNIVTIVLPGPYATDFLGGSLLASTAWSQGLPTPTSTGRVNVSGTVADRFQDVSVIQTGGTVTFTNSQTFRSAIESSTWRLQGGSITDSNSGFRLNDTQLFVEGGAIHVTGGDPLSLGQGDVLLAISSGSVAAEALQVGTIGNFPGSKIVRLSSTGQLTLLSASPLTFGNDGDTANDFVDLLTGWTGSITTLAGSSYFETQWANGRLRVNGQTGASLGVNFIEAGFLVMSSGGGQFTLARTPLPGDFNFDNQVDSADYTVWRDGLGNGFGQAHLDLWRAKFGQFLAVSAATSVPEPATGLGLCLGLIFLGFARRQFRGKLAKKSK